MIEVNGASSKSAIEEAFLKSYDAYIDAIFRHCYFRVYDRERAKDLAQEVFTRVWEYIVRGNEIKNTRPFLYRVANNLIIDESRKKKETSLDALRDKGFDAAFTGAPDPHRDFDVKTVLASIHKLEETYREIMVMRYVDDLSPKEIAGILELSENVVSVRIHRGIKQLIKLIQG